MLLCESDAKFKYCPLLKTHDDKLKFCLGSMCMFWRWENGGAGDDPKGYCGLGGGVAAVAAAAAMGSGGTAAAPREDD